MDADKLLEGRNLDWQMIAFLLKGNFTDKDRELLIRLYGLEGHSQHSKKELRAFSGLRGKKLEERLTRLENRLFQLLKDKNPEEIILD